MGRHPRQRSSLSYRQYEACSLRRSCRRRPQRCRSSSQPWPWQRIPDQATVPHHLQEKTTLKTIYETVYEEKCNTVYDTDYKTEYETTYETACETSYKKECYGYGYDKKCKSVPVEKCHQVPKQIPIQVPIQV